MELGGYTGWKLDGDCSGHLAVENVAEFDALLEASRKQFFHLNLRRFDGDWLALYTNADRALLLHNGRRVVGECSDDLLPEVFRSESRPLGVYVPASNTVPKAEALSATREYFLTDHFPEGIKWEHAEESHEDWLSKEIITSLRHLFGYSQEGARDLLCEYNARRTERQAKFGAQFHDDEFLAHEGPESMAYIVQWIIVLGEEPGSLAFLDWRKADYERRESPLTE